MSNPTLEFDITAFWEFCRPGRTGQYTLICTALHCSTVFLVQGIDARSSRIEARIRIRIQYKNADQDPYPRVEKSTKIIVKFNRLQVSLVDFYTGLRIRNDLFRIRIRIYFFYIPDPTRVFKLIKIT